MLSTPADPFGDVGAASSNAEESSPPQKNTKKSLTARRLNSSAARLELNGHQISVEDFGATAFGECLANCGTIWNLLNCTGNVENLESIESS